MFALPPISDDPLHDAIRLADWMELNILLEEEETISVEEITYLLEEIPPDRFEEISPGASDDNEDREHFHDSEAKAESAFEELRARYSWLKLQYPLRVEKGVALLHHENQARDIYRFLILLRARQMYPGHLDDDGTESGFLFEEIVSCALGAYIEGHQVRFGLADDGQRGDGLPQATLQALQDLSRRMHERMTTEGVSEKIQDYGGDAVAWKSFGDGHPGQMVLIGQATISEKKWMLKEPSLRWIGQRLIQFLAMPIRAVAFAETISLTSRDTLEGARFSSIPFDRLRLLSVLTDKDLPTDLRDRMNQWSNHVGMSLGR